MHRRIACFLNPVCRVGLFFTAGVLLSSGFALAQSPPVRMCTETPAPPWCDAVRGDRAEKIPSAVLKPDYVGQARAFANQLADRLGCVDRE